jgi:hypothetical protein
MISPFAVLAAEENEPEIYFAQEGEEYEFLPQYEGYVLAEMDWSYAIEMLGPNHTAEDVIELLRNNPRLVGYLEDMGIGEDMWHQIRFTPEGIMLGHYSDFLPDRDGYILGDIIEVIALHESEPTAQVGDENFEIVNIEVTIRPEFEGRFVLEAFDVVHIMGAFIYGREMDDNHDVISTTIPEVNFYHAGIFQVMLYYSFENVFSQVMLDIVELTVTENNDEDEEEIEDEYEEEEIEEIEEEDDIAPFAVNSATFSHVTNNIETIAILNESVTLQTDVTIHLDNDAEYVTFRWRRHWTVVDAASVRNYYEYAGETFTRPLDDFYTTVRIETVLPEGVQSGNYVLYAYAGELLGYSAPLRADAWGLGDPAY